MPSKQLSPILMTLAGAVLIVVLTSKFLLGVVVGLIVSVAMSSLRERDEK